MSALRFLCFLFVGSVATALADPAAEKPTEKPPSEAWKLGCMFAWGNIQCKNFVQAAVAGPGGMFQGLPMVNQFNCMKQPTKDACGSYGTDDDTKCYWCEIPEPYRPQFGDGTCMHNQMAAVGACTFVPGSSLYPLSQLRPEDLQNNKIPNSVEQAVCLEQNKDKATCEDTKHGGFQCRYCELPVEYGWRPYRGFCLQDFLIGNSTWGACRALNDLPDGAFDFLEATEAPTLPPKGTPATEPPTTKPPATTGKPYTTETSSAPAYLTFGAAMLMTVLAL